MKKANVGSRALKRDLPRAATVCTYCCRNVTIRPCDRSAIKVSCVRTHSPSISRKVCAIFLAIYYIYCSTSRSPCPRVERSNDPRPLPTCHHATTAVETEGGEYTSHDDAVSFPVPAWISRGGPRESRSPIESRRVRAVAYFNKKEH